MNITWSEAQDSEDPASLKVLEHWDGGNTNIYVTLVIFIVLKVCGSNCCGFQLPLSQKMFFALFFCFVLFPRTHLSLPRPGNQGCSSFRF